MTRAKRLVVTESTFSWWAAFLNAGGVVHAPGNTSGKPPGAAVSFWSH
jgi:hypothetical protein